MLAFDGVRVVGAEQRQAGVVRFFQLVAGRREPAEDARTLARLIADARFFDQPEQFPPSGTADGFGYTITVEMNGQRHTVNVDEGKVPAELQPLVEWLSGRAQEDGPIGCLPPPPPM
jgi:hypothetical protein